MIGELLDALTRALISSSPDSKLHEMTVRWSVMEVHPLEGDGHVTILSDDDLLKKSYNPSKNAGKNGSVLYVHSEDDCFFVAAYECWLYHMTKIEEAKMVEERAKESRKYRKRQIALDIARLKEERRKRYDRDGASQRSEALRFYEDRGVDIDGLAVGDLTTLEEMNRIFDRMQVSIYDQTLQYRRVLMFPTEYSPASLQISLLRVAQPSFKEKIESRHNQITFHYHGCRNVNGVIRGQGFNYCAWCQRRIHQNLKTHECPTRRKSEFQTCRGCSRLTVAENDLGKIPITLRKEFCPTPLVRAKTRKSCDKCRFEFVSATCAANHKAVRCKKYFICDKCSGKVKYRGKYLSTFRAERHDDCEEAWCQHCNDYFNATSHYCLTRRPERTQPWPAGLGVFDIEVRR